MASGNVEEVGARLLVEGGAAFTAAFDAARDSVVGATGAITDFGKAAATMSRRTERLGSVVDASGAKITASLEDSNVALQTGTDRLTTFSDAQARAADVSKTSAASIARSQKVTRDAMLGGAAGRKAKVGGAAAAYTESWKHATKAATKIVKVGMLGVTAVAYEGIKKYMTFQQQMAQLAVDAGVKKSQLPAFEKIAMNISNATGLAATNVGDLMYRIASANPKIGMTTKSMEAMGKAAGQLYVLAGNTGNYDSIGRLYGAITSNRLSLKRGGKGLAYNAKSGKAINEWVLGTVGHGDMKTGDLVAAMSTGILPVAKSYGLSLNQVGAMLDVLSPAMNASAAATRLKTAIGMLGSPSQKASQAAELVGGSATTMAGLLRSKGPVAVMNYLAGLENKAMSGKTFIGGGIFGASSGKYSGIKGAADWLKAYGFTNPKLLSTLQTKGIRGLAGLSSTQLQAMGFTKGMTGKQAEKTVLSNIIGQMFGGGHTGAAVMQLLNERGTLASKQRALTGMETNRSYEKALKLAFNEPIVKWNKFKQEVENVTIAVGKDLTPAFDDLLSTLERIGGWFGHNKWALKDLGYLAGGVFGGAAAIKGAETITRIYKGASSITRMITHPLTGIRGIAKFDGVAGALTNAATELKGAANALKGAAGVEEEGGFGGPPSTYSRIKSRLGKLAGRGTLAFIGGEAYNQMVAPLVSHYMGHKTGKVVNDVFRDAAIGGTLGSAFGMWGGLAGGIGGALVGAFQALGWGKSLKDAVHYLQDIARKLGAIPHGAARAAHDLTPGHWSPVSLWDDLFGGGGSKPKPKHHPLIGPSVTLLHHPSKPKHHPLIGPPVSLFTPTKPKHHPLIGPSVATYLHSMRTANTKIPEAAKTISDAATKTHEAATTQGTAASTIYDAATMMQQAVGTFGTKVSEINTNLDPSHVHHTATKGLHHAVARK